MSDPPTLSKKPPTDADDDLDDLDDVLDQFQPSVSASKKEPAQPSTYGRPRTNTRVDKPPISTPGAGLPSIDATGEVDEEALTNQFVEELAKGMENLMRNFKADPSTSGDVSESPGIDEAQKKAMMAAWEAMLVEDMNVAAGEPEKQDQKDSAPMDSFQKTIQETLERLKQSESNLQSSNEGSSATAGGADSLESILASLGNTSGEGEEGMAELLEEMMTQLMSKEVLYDPIKELSEKFPLYLQEPTSSITEEDRKRYEEQIAIVNQVLAVFDAPDYKDSDPEKAKEIVDLMSKLQSLGAPPEEVMGPLPPGLGFGPDGMSEGCVIA